MHETSKATRRRSRDPLFAERYFVGHGIDIGAGPDPLEPKIWPWCLSVDEWDLEDGDAQYMVGAGDAHYDFVYSSHCLEHMVDPVIALQNWWRILKPGGHLVLVVPDEDLYEQGVWPPTWNTDHKHTFAVAKASSWSPVSRNVDELLRALGGEVVKIERITEGFLPPELCHARFGQARVDQTSAPWPAECCIEAVVKKPKAGL